MLYKSGAFCMSAEIMAHFYEIPMAGAYYAPAILDPDKLVIKVRISQVKVITMPPEIVSIPLERWEGSWDWRDRPT